MQRNSSCSIAEQLLLNGKSFSILRLQEEEHNVNNLIYAIQLNRTVHSVFLHGGFLVSLNMPERRRLLGALGCLPQLRNFVYTPDSKKVRIPMDALADFIESSHRLAVFEMNSPNLVGKEIDFVNFSAGLGRLKGLHRFKLLPVFFEPAQLDLNPIFDALTAIDTLEEVCISLKCERGSQLFSSVLKYLCRSDLRVLDLRWAHLTESHVETIARELRDSTCLTDLAIGGCHLGTQSCLAMADMIEVNEGIRRFCFASKALSSDKCCIALWDAFDANPLIEEITLENTDMYIPSYKSARTISEVLAKNKTVVVLRLFNMGLDDISCTLIANAITTNSTLKELDLRKGNERISNQGYEALAKMLEQNYTLQKLHTNATGRIREHLDLCIRINQSAHTFQDSGKYNLGKSKDLFQSFRQITMCK